MKKSTFKAKHSVYYLSLVTLIVACVGIVTNHLKTQSLIATASANLDMIRAAQAPTQELNLKNSELEAELEAFKSEYPDPTREEIEMYVRKIFGRDANVALAVSHHECGYTNKNYPKCHLKSGVEHSVGLFQINLYNSRQLIHADRIPGGTMQEKILWLENPFNNTLYAYWVYKTSGWHPWSAYTNGSYLKDPLMQK